MNRSIIFMVFALLPMPSNFTRAADKVNIEDRKQEIISVPYPEFSFGNEYQPNYLLFVIQEIDQNGDVKGKWLAHDNDGSRQDPWEMEQMLKTLEQVSAFGGLGGTSFNADQVRIDTILFSHHEHLYDERLRKMTFEDIKECRINEITIFVPKSESGERRRPSATPIPEAGPSKCEELMQSTDSMKKRFKDLSPPEQALFRGKRRVHDVYVITDTQYIVKSGQWYYFPKTDDATVRKIEEHCKLLNCPSECEKSKSIASSKKKKKYSELFKEAKKLFNGKSKWDNIYGVFGADYIVKVGKWYHFFKFDDELVEKIKTECILFKSECERSLKPHTPRKPFGKLSKEEKDLFRGKQRVHDVYVITDTQCIVKTGPMYYYFPKSEEKTVQNIQKFCKPLIMSGALPPKNDENDVETKNNWSNWMIPLIILCIVFGLLTVCIAAFYCSRRCNLSLRRASIADENDDHQSISDGYSGNGIEDEREQMAFTHLTETA